MSPFKRYAILTGCLATLAATPALAENRPGPQLMRSVELGLQELGMQVDLETLQAHEIASLHLVLHQNSATASQKRAHVRSILGGLDVLIFGQNLSWSR